jgi:glycosyltransferase involved in cell wall biosynthesis
MSISVCLITKNEEKWLAACLDSLAGWVDEIIVVDTGSVDATVEIAREKGARVSLWKWTGDFSKARNASLEKATQSWILVLDPDERVAPEDQLRLKNLSQDLSVMGYSFQTRNYTDNSLASGFTPCSGQYPSLEGNYSGYFESKKVRLFQNLPQHRFTGSVHELVESTIQGKIVESDIPIHHYGSTQEEVVRKEKRRFYREQTKVKVEENPKDWKSHFEMGIELLTGGDPKAAAKALEQARVFAPQEVLVLSNLGYALMESGKFKEAEGVLKQCLSLDARSHDGLLNLGVTKMRQKLFDEALSIFDQLLKVHPQSFMAFRNAGNCYAQKKDLQKAARCFEQAIKIFPQFHEAKVDLGLVCFAGGRMDLAEPLLKEVVRVQPESHRAQMLLEEIEKLKTQARQ